MEIRPAVLDVILLSALVTVVPRVLPLVLLSRVSLPPWALRWLENVPIAVLSALLAQELLLFDGRIALPPDNLALLAAVPALLMAAATRSLMGTVAVGVAAMAVLRWVAPG
jgi:branched-subunit amino acid transport protein